MGHNWPELRSLQSVAIVQIGGELHLDEGTPLEARQMEKVGCGNFLDSRGWLVGRKMETKIAPDFWTQVPLLLCHLPAIL